MREPYLSFLFSSGLYCIMNVLTLLLPVCALLSKLLAPVQAYFTGGDISMF
jgi:hypothetical protein